MDENYRVFCMYKTWCCALHVHWLHVLARMCYGVWVFSCTAMRRLTTGIRSEKCVVRRFRRRSNVIECTYTNLDSIAYYTPSQYGIAYCS